MKNADKFSETIFTRQGNKD